MINSFEKDKQEAFEKIKDILGSFVFTSDWEISLYADSQLEKMLKCMALNKDYTNEKKEYMCFELPYVYFKLKEAYKDFERSRWILLTYEVMKTHN
jgi:hypothetical protein